MLKAFLWDARASADSNFSRFSFLSTRLYSTRFVSQNIIKSWRQERIVVYRKWYRLETRKDLSVEWGKTQGPTVQDNLPSYILQILLKLSPNWGTSRYQFTPSRASSHSHTRQYSTHQTSSSPNRHWRQPPHANLRRRGRKPRFQRSRASRQQIHGKKRFTSHESSGYLSNAKRKRWLLREHRRLKDFLNLTDGMHRDTLMKSGRYRALRRRIINLGHSKSSVMDARLQNKPLEDDYGHLRAFAALDRITYRKFGRLTLPFRIIHDWTCPLMAEELFQGRGEEDIADIWQTWKNLNNDTRVSTWRYLLYFLLDQQPGHVIAFIQILVRSPEIIGSNVQVLADALGHLARIHIGKLYKGSGWAVDPAHNKAKFAPTFYRIFLDALAHYRYICSQDLLVDIAKLSDVDDLMLILDKLIEFRTFMTPHTLLHYANIFARANEHGYALRCLEHIQYVTPKAGSQREILARRKFVWSCALILRKSTRGGQDFHQTTQIVAFFVKMGVKLDILLYNVIMRNAMEAGDYQTAFRVYNTLEENGLKADKFTYSILLPGCSMMPDPTRFEDFAEHCAQIARSVRDPWLATDYLYYLYVCHHSGDGNSRQYGFTRIATAYTQFFRSDPLEPFRARGLDLLHTWTEIDEDAPHFKHMSPPPVALYIMVQTLIKKASKASANRIWSVYMLFKRLIKLQQHPALVRLARAPIIWNAFLFAMCKKKNFAFASQIIKDMTDGSPQPNIYTWNIFMQAFFKESQIQAAERVFDIARSQGAQPNQYTWGVLLRGYARAQHAERIGEIMEYVDDENQFDPQLLQVLSRIQPQKQMIRELEKSRQKRMSQMVAEAQEKAREREARWASPFHAEVTVEGVDPVADDGRELGETRLLGP